MTEIRCATGDTLPLRSQRGRSQIAAAFARQIGGDQVVVHSRIDPGEKLNPAVVEAMMEVVSTYRVSRRRG